MEQRYLGTTGREVSVVGLGTWQLGTDWGEVDESQGRGVLEAAVDAGVTFFDTADVYGDGRSESIIGAFLRAHAGPAVTVATKMGRRVEQVPENYHLEAFRAWTDRSRANLGVERLDLVQLHCPPSVVHGDDAVFESLETLVDEGRIAAYGVSVETCDEALAAMEHPGLASVQIILNAFRRKPLERVLPTAAEKGVGIIARVPLASACCPAGTRTTRSSRRATTGPTTDTGRASTSGRPSRASTTTPVWTRRRSSPPSPPTSAPPVPPGAGRPAVDHPAAGRDDRHPRGAQCRAGPRQRRGGRAARPLRGAPRRGRAPLRRADPGPGARPLVMATGALPVRRAPDAVRGRPYGTKVMTEPVVAGGKSKPTAAYRAPSWYSTALGPPTARTSTGVSPFAMEIRPPNSSET